MSGERLSSNSRGNRVEKPEWMEAREQDLNRKKKIGEIAFGTAAAVIVAIALSHSAKTLEIMEDEERAKNVKKIEAEAVVFHDVNMRGEPFVDNANPNQLAVIDGKGQNVVVDYGGEAYYFNNKNDANGYWIGFDANKLAGTLKEGGFITEQEVNNINGDSDNTVWVNGKYVSIIEPGEADRMAAEWVD